jgi:hypothetical protein
VCVFTSITTTINTATTTTTTTAICSLSFYLSLLR